MTFGLFLSCGKTYLFISFASSDVLFTLNKSQTYKELSQADCVSDRLHSYHEVFQLHVQHICPMDELLPVVAVFLCIHVVQDQLKEDELLRDGAEGVVEAEHVVSVLQSFYAGRQKKR